MSNDFKTDSTKRHKQEKRNRQAVYAIISNDKVTNWQTTHKGYGVPLKGGNDERKNDKS